jgi:Uma2 family endonuclease
MIALPKHKMNVDQFLAWAEAQPKEAGRFELWDGEVIAKHGPAGDEMNAERNKHAIAKGEVYVALRAAIRLSGLPWRALVDGPSIRFSDGKLVEPDVVACLGAEIDPNAMEVTNPAIVVEVLSPSTQKLDLSWKLEAYFTLPSIQHYLVVDPDKPVVIHHKRGQGEIIETRFVATPALRLDPPGLVVDLTEVLAVQR